MAAPVGLVAPSEPVGGGKTLNCQFDKNHNPIFNLGNVRRSVCILRLMTPFCQFGTTNDFCPPMGPSPANKSITLSAIASLLAPGSKQ